MINQNAITKIQGINFREFLLKYGLYIGFVIIFVVLSILSPSFLTIGNIINVIDQFAYYIIGAIGMLFVVITGGVDLSNSGMIALAGVLGATVMVNTKNVILGCIVVIGISSLGGLINGLSIARVGMPAFVATLAFQNINRGTAFTLTSGRTIAGLPESITSFNFKRIFGIRSSIFILIVVFFIAYYLLNHTKFGKMLYAVGDNSKASRVMGINVKRVKIFAYTICGICTGIATIILVSYMGSARAAVAENLHLECIAAVMIGGASATGGEGKITGTLLGAMLFAMLKNGLNLLGFSYYYQLIASGIIIYIAATIDRMRVRAGY